ncbi:MAG TPA: TatD family hydrolase [bacterium]|nr:TatD family hydrolase [bacterium]
MSILVKKKEEDFTFSTVALIDSHCHLPTVQEKDSLNHVLMEARDWGVIKMLNIGTSIAENEKVLEIACLFANVSAAVAIYPHKDLERSVDELKTYLTEFIAKNREDLVAIGECGIDISSLAGGRSLNDQIELFSMQAGLAKDFNLPLIIHNRKGDLQVLEVLRKIRPRKAVIHCFSSTWDFAQEVLNMGYFVSFSGFITYDSKSHLLETVKNVPMDRFLVETDSPYISPKGHHAEKNEPKYVRLVAEKVAVVKGTSLEKVALHSTANAQSFFGI